MNKSASTLFTHPTPLWSLVYHGSELITLTFPGKMARLYNGTLTAIKIAWNKSLPCHFKLLHSTILTPENLTYPKYMPIWLWHSVKTNPPSYLLIVPVTVPLTCCLVPHLPRAGSFPSQPESAAMKTYIEEELAKGFIRPSTSPAASGFFFVKEKDGGLRPCIDYRGLNDITVKFRYPLPLVPPALEQLRQAAYFTKLDLRCAYNLICIREGDEWKTAFSTATGRYETLVMPFGLSNSPSVFQSFINDVFPDMLNRWVIVYIDDILIYSNSFEEHVQHVRAVLQRLIQHKLYAKAEKCEFHQTSTTFLGYVISREGVAMDDSKVRAVLDWPQPRTLKELQRFLGFANFYWRFIRNFSGVAAPLTSMTKQQSLRLIWSSEAVQAFQELSPQHPFSITQTPNSLSL